MKVIIPTEQEVCVDIAIEQEAEIQFPVADQYAGVALTSEQSVAIEFPTEQEVELFIRESLCPEIVYVNFGTYKSGTELHITWDTNVGATSRARYRLEGAEVWTYTSTTFAYNTSHDKATIDPIVPDRRYEHQVYGVNECLLTPGWSDSIIIVISGGGEPSIEGE